jgi:hypothetical protein
MNKNGKLNIKKCQCNFQCEECIIGKLSQSPFPHRAKPTKNVLDVIVSDVCGPIETDLMSKSKYFVTFIDAHSRYCEVFFMKHKNEVAVRLQEYFDKLFNIFGVYPIILRSENGREYQNKDVLNYLKKNGI